MKIHYLPQGMTLTLKDNGTAPNGPALFNKPMGRPATSIKKIKHTALLIGARLWLKNKTVSGTIFETQIRHNKD